MYLAMIAARIEETMNFALAGERRGGGSVPAFISCSAVAFCYLSMCSFSFYTLGYFLGVSGLDSG